MINVDNNASTPKLSVGDVRPARTALRNIVNTTCARSTSLSGTPAVKRKSSAQLGKDMKTHSRN
jgi:hypothetical protein